MSYEELHNTELEKGLLSALIYDGYADFTILTDGLTPECFSDVQLRRLFLALRNLNSQGMSIHDLMLIIEAMNRVDPNVDADNNINSNHSTLNTQSPTVNAVDFISMLEGATYRREISENIPHYARMLIDYRKRRTVYELMDKAMGHVLDLTADINDTADSLVRDITRADCDGTTEILAMTDLMARLRETIGRNVAGGDTMGLRTGFRHLDQTGGLHPSDLVIIAADSSQGKTALATTIAMNIIDADVNLKPETSNLKPPTSSLQPNVAYYSLEMTPQQLVARMISHQVGISGTRMAYKKLSDEELRRFDAAEPRILSVGDRLFVDERSVTTPESIMQSIRYLHSLHGIDCAIIDYLQILGLKGGRYQSREQVIADAARGFKNLARELDIVIILLSQLNREGSSVNPQPSIARIRDSGEINEASDLTLLIYRPEVYGLQYQKPWDYVDTRGTAMITVAKDRHGSYGGIGSFIVGFTPEQSYFHDLQQLPKKPVVMPQNNNQRPW